MSRKDAQGIAKCYDNLYGDGINSLGGGVCGHNILSVGVYKPLCTLMPPKEIIQLCSAVGIPMRQMVVILEVSFS